MKISLSQDFPAFAALLDNDEFIYTLTESRGIQYDADFSLILKMDDFKNTKFDTAFDTEGEGTLSSAIELFLQGLIPDYSFESSVANNLGSVVRKGGKISFYGCGIYSDLDGQLYLSIGGTDRRLGLEPYKAPLVWSKELKRWEISGCSLIFTEYSSVIDLGSDRMVNTCHLAGKCVVGEDIHFLTIWVSLAKNEGDPDKSQGAQEFIKAWNKPKLSFEGIVGKQGSGGGIVAKCNGLFSKYFELGVLQKYAFPVIGISLEKRQKKDGESFEVLNIIPDFSGYPEIPAIAIDFQSQSKEKTVPITEVIAIQFSKNTGSKESKRPSKYYQKLLDAQAGKIPMPSPENPWFLVFTSPPKKPNNTPDFQFWAGFVPPTVKELAERCKSIGFINPSSVSQLQKAIEVTSTRSEFVPDISDPFADEDF